MVDTVKSTEDLLDIDFALGQADRAVTVQKVRDLLLSVANTERTVPVDSLRPLPDPTPSPSPDDGQGIGHRIEDGLTSEIGYKTNAIQDYPIIGKSLIHGADPTLSTRIVGGSTLVYTGSGALIRGYQTGGLTIHETQLVGIQGFNQTAFDISCSSFVYRFSNVLNFDSIGTINTSLFTLLNQLLILGFSVEGLTLEGSSYSNALVADTVQCQYGVPMGGKSVLTLKGQGFTVGSNNVSLFSLPGDYALDIDKDIDYTAIKISNSNFEPVFGGTPLAPTSLTQKTKNVKLLNVSPIPDSSVSGQSFLQETGSAIGTIDIPLADAQIIANVDGWVSSIDTEERIIFNSDGSFIYDGRAGKVVDIDRELKIDQAVGSQTLGIKEWCLAPTLNITTFDNVTNTVLRTTHGLVDDDTISFRGTLDTDLPAELRNDAIYYVVNAATDSFQVSYTLGGAAITFTDDGSTETTSPWLDSGIHLHGLDSKITFDNHAELAFGTGEYSIFFKIDNLPTQTNQYIFDGRSAIQTMHATTGANLLEFKTSSTLTSTVSVTDGEPHYCLATRDGSNNVKLYVDGVLEDTGTDTIDYNSIVGFWHLGRSHVNTNALEGDILDFKIFDRELTEDERTKLFTGGQVTTDVKQQYLFTERYGDTVSGVGSDGTLVDIPLPALYRDAKSIGSASTETFAAPQNLKSGSQAFLEELSEVVTTVFETSANENIRVYSGHVRIK